MIFDAIAIEEKIDYSFNDKMLLRRCFTHSSYANEHNEVNNELLEFYGDAIIEFFVTEYLFNNQSGDEGKLTEKRQSIVSNANLLKTVKKLGIFNFVLLGNGQEKNCKIDEKLFASIYESLVAGLFIDGGYNVAKNFIYKTLISDFISDYKKNFKKDNNAQSKSTFQEYVQKRKLGSISYETLLRTGPDHLPMFKVAALLNNTKIAEGKGSTKKMAEALAAKSALTKLKKQDGKKN